MYLIFALINVFALSPVTGAEYSDNAGSISEANGKDAASDSAEAEESRLVFAMLQVLGDYAMWIRKRRLRLSESDAVLQLILAVLDLDSNRIALSPLEYYIRTIQKAI